MLPKQPIAIPQDAFDAAAALRTRLNDAAAGRHTVGVGLKQIGGEFTDQIALFVYVWEKKPASEVPEAELVPRESGGYVTDVVQARPVLIDDTNRYNPLRGGIQISREQTLADGIFAPKVGTMGAIVRSRETGAPQLLTCAHVVKQSDLNVYQPAFTSLDTDKIGTVFAMRREASPLFLDCAVIDLNGSRDVELSVQDIGPVEGVSTKMPALGEAVKKRGVRTLLTHGFVVGLISSLFMPAVEHILISGGVPFVSVFAGRGDSGSVVLNESNQVIGLLCAIPNEDLGPELGSHGLAMPIHNVQEALQVDIAT